jgi:hypothetical protein
MKYNNTIPEYWILDIGYSPCALYLDFFAYNPLKAIPIVKGFTEGP